MRVTKEVWKFNKILSFFADILLPYSWSYRSGFADGMKKTDYYRGYSDGQNDTHEFYQKNASFKLIKKRK